MRIWVSLVSIAYWYGSSQSAPALISVSFWLSSVYLSPCREPPLMCWILSRSSWLSISLGLAIDWDSMRPWRALASCTFTKPFSTPPLAWSLPVWDPLGSRSSLACALPDFITGRGLLLWVLLRLINFIFFFEILFPFLSFSFEVSWSELKEEAWRRFSLSTARWLMSIGFWRRPLRRARSARSLGAKFSKRSKFSPMSLSGSDRVSSSFSSLSVNI